MHMYYVTGCSKHYDLNTHNFFTLCTKKMVVKQLLYLIVKHMLW
jgi:hypothetical protein